VSNFDEYPPIVYTTEKKKFLNKREKLDAPLFFEERAGA